MLLKSKSPVHFDHVDRKPEPQNEQVGVSSDEVVALLGSLYAFGTWRLEIETGHVFWTEDASYVHGMKPSSEPLSLARMLACYHPEDAVLIEELLGSATYRRNSFRFVMRVKDGRGAYRLIAVAGRFRPENGGELIGYCHEYHDMVRAVVLEGGEQ